jgi:hypothetical protein
VDCCVARAPILSHFSPPKILMKILSIPVTSSGRMNYSTLVGDLRNEKECLGSGSHLSSGRARRCQHRAAT